MYNSKNEIPESGETGENFFDVSRLSLHDKGWISPPESITSCSSDSGVTSSETSLADTSNGPDIMDPIHHSVDGREGREHSLLSPSVGIPLPEMSPSEQSRSQNMQETSGLKLLPNIETSLSTQERVEDNSEAPVTNTEASSRTRGKNPYAVSVLRRMEMKLDGRDIVDDRELSVGEQVDYLLKQATSIDNLCNMYEGWTPWI
nr:serine/threonine-protein kinase SMG1-like [Ipomoea batatas]